MKTDSNSLPERPRWFSIKDAADYLDVGEPTLFRWMRDGKITYRKVGDSTRFFQEDLDSVMETFHSTKDVSNVSKICPLCHGAELVEGVFRTTGLNYFQPRKTRFWTLKASNIDTTAFMCRTCGHVSLFGDANQLAALVQEKKTEAPPEKQEKPEEKPAE